MCFHTPAHKQVDPAAQPAQRVRDIVTLPQWLERQRNAKKARVDGKNGYR